MNKIVHLNIFGKKFEGKKYKERVAAYGIVFENKKIALIQTPKGYFLPGGGIEKNEKIEPALEREFSEELGWTINIIKYIGQATQLFYSKGEDIYFQSLGNFFIVERRDTIIKESETDHILTWYSPGDARLLLSFEYQSWAVEQAVTFSH